MTKLQNQGKHQLELRLLSDLKARTEGTKTTDVAAEVQQIGQPARLQESASETDLSIYRQISSNYFTSLRKA